MEKYRKKEKEGMEVHQYVFCFFNFFFLFFFSVFFEGFMCIRGICGCPPGVGIHLSSGGI